MSGKKIHSVSTDTLSDIVTEADLAVLIPVQTQDDSTAVDVAGIVADFNALLAKLRAANILTD